MQPSAGPGPTGHWVPTGHTRSLARRYTDLPPLQQHHHTPSSRSPNHPSSLHHNTNFEEASDAGNSGDDYDDELNDDTTGTVI